MWADALHAGHRARREKIPHLFPVVRRPERESQDDITSRVRGAPASAKISRRTGVRLMECVVESTDASESGREGDLGHRQAGLVEESLREMELPGLSDVDRRRVD